MKPRQTAAEKRKQTLLWMRKYGMHVTDLYLGYQAAKAGVPWEKVVATKIKHKRSNALDDRFFKSARS